MTSGDLLQVSQIYSRCEEKPNLYDAGCVIKVSKWREVFKYESFSETMFFFFFSFLFNPSEALKPCLLTTIFAGLFSYYFVL